MKAKKTWAKNKSPAAASSKHQSTGEKVLKELKEKHELPGIILGIAATTFHELSECIQSTGTLTNC